MCSCHLGHVGMVVRGILEIAGHVIVGEPVVMLQTESLRQQLGRLGLEKLVKVFRVQPTLGSGTPRK